MTDDKVTKPDHPSGVEDKSLPIIGILGDGQLAMMMTQAYQVIGGRVWVFGTSADAPAADYADQFFLGDIHNISQLETFFSDVDLVTLENEFLDSERLVSASQSTGVPVYPEPERYRLIEDKLSEKQFFDSLGIDQARFFEVTSQNDLIDQPGYLKLAKGGYDGIGTFKVNNLDEAVEIYRKIESAGTILFEHRVKFKKELSMIAVKNEQGLVVYPLVETQQEHGTCRFVSYPSGVSEAVENNARVITEKIMSAIDTRGLFAFEFFLTEDDQLLLNESAPRPHNSGHITLDLMDCSQFENHMRAVANMPLIEPKLIKPSALMINLLATRDGDFDPARVTRVIEDTNLTINLYGKKRARVKRKMGHINLWGDNLRERANQIVEQLDI